VPLIPTLDLLPDRPHRPLRVLVAEDNPINQRLVGALLERRGHAPVMAADGREAVANLEIAAFDIVLMDLEMRGMDGFAAAAAIRDRERSTGAHVPIIALSAHADPGSRQRCLAAGMDGYLTKPLRYDELIAAVEGSWPRQGERTAPGGACREISAPFVADAQRLAAEIRDAVALRDGATLARAAHQLRGTAGYFAAERTRELAQLLEELGREGDLSVRIQEVCAELDLELDRLELMLTPAGNRDRI
jgi:two-component system, sensor histidine kinase and response regulator